MRLGKGKRRALGWLACIIAVFIIVILAVPAWFPWVLRPVAASRGLTFSTYARHGYGRFSLSQVTFTNAQIQLTAAKTELLVPTVWIWKCQGHAPPHDFEFAHVEDWNLKIGGTNNSTKPQSGASSIYTNFLDIRNIVQILRQWLPRAELMNGEVLVGTNTIRIANLSWDRGKIKSRLEAPGLKTAASIQAELTPYLYDIHFDSETARVAGELTLYPNAQGIDLNWTGTWISNAFGVQAHFNKTDLLPETARVSGENLQIRGSDVGLTNYNVINGRAEAGWTNGHFTCVIAARGTPDRSSTNMPPVTINVRASGDTNIAVIESAQVSLPWLEIQSSPNVRLHFHGTLLREPADLTVRADINRQQWLDAHGIVQGTAQLEPGEDKYPRVALKLSGTNVGNLQIDATAFTAVADVRWPQVNLQRVTATLDDRSSLSAKGTINFETKNISDAQVMFTGTAATRWLPAYYGYDNATLAANLSGPLTNLLHEGRLTVTNLTISDADPMQVQLDWKGQQTSIEHAIAQLSSHNTQVDAAFKLAISPTNSSVSLEADIESLLCKESQTNLFTLQRPAHLSFQTINSNHWNAASEPLEFDGPAGHLAVNGTVDWPNRGALQFSAVNVDSEKLPLPSKWRFEPTLLRKLNFVGGWTNGPLIFTVDAGAETKLRNGSTQQHTNRFMANLGDLGAISAHLEAHGDGETIVLTNFSVQTQTSAIAVAHGFIPFSLHPANVTNSIQINAKAPAEFSISTEPNSIFWQKFSDWTGVRLREPSVRAEVTGTWEHPRGTVLIKASEITLPKDRFPVPDLEMLDIRIGLDRQTATLTNLSLLVQKQPVVATAHIPLGESFWSDLKNKKPPNWHQASWRLQINRAQIAAFSGMFPALLAPQGTFHLDVELQPGARLSGALSLKDARTRPISNLGPIRDIDVSLKFTEHELRLAEGDVTIGGSPLIASGAANLAGTEWLRGARPPFEFTLSGTNIPLSRRPESIIRSDLRIGIKHTNGAPPLISGFVRLHDSYYLSDLSALVPGKQASIEQRPPYFSLSDTNLADWRLALRVGGERGLRVRSTLFVGKVSPNLRLQGTLKEPIALGDVKIDSGTVKFPFANLDVQRGYVTLTSENPYRPQLMVTAGSKNFGYDVRMEVTGPADQPIIQFSSTPPLSSEQLVLMVTAGELPKTGYTLSPSQRAQTMALFLGKDMLNKLGFGDQSEDRLTFSSGAEISETGRPTYSLEYKLTDRWSLVGEYDRFNAFNAGMKWKVYSK